MKTNLFLVFFCITVSAYSQDYDLLVSSFTSTCTGKTTKGLEEPQTRWKLSSQKAELYFTSKYDKSQRQTILLFNVKEIKIENDPINGKAYIYNISSYKSGEGTLIYVPQENFVKIVLGENNCGTTYDLY